MSNLKPMAVQIPASKNIQNLDHEFELQHPETIADAEYDKNVRFLKSPLKYVTQKWFKKRTRQVRYSITDEKLQEFDDRRLIDARFWLFLCNVSNTYY